MPTLRDGRTVELAPARDGELAALEELRAGDPRRRELEAARVTIARSDGPVGFAAWFEDGEFVCGVEESFAGIGLGTLLVRHSAAEAAAAGLAKLRIALPPGAHALASMLRDCGLVSTWDLEHPVATVELTLARQRPGWATP